MGADEEGVASGRAGRDAEQGAARGVGAEPEWEAHVSQAMRSVLSSDRDLVLCGEAGLGGLLKVELLEAVECRGESESWRKGEGVT